VTLLQSPAMRRAILASCAGILAATACSKKPQDGLPPPTEWQAGSAAAPGTATAPPLPPPPNMRGVPRANPHAGMAMGGDPANPHAGMDMGGEPSDPHAGLDMSGAAGTDVTKLGLPPPDPDRPINPSHRIAGTIRVDAGARGKVKPGTAVFLMVKRAGADGAPVGQPLAVDKLSWSGDGIAFELTDEQAMTAGTDLSGDVVVIARYDQDSDALSRQPGDITGQVRVAIPASGVKLTLDTVLP
jgi:hypothetical protein